MKTNFIKVALVLVVLAFFTACTVDDLNENNQQQTLKEEVDPTKVVPPTGG